MSHNAFPSPVPSSHPSHPSHRSHDIPDDRLDLIDPVHLDPIDPTSNPSPKPDPQQSWGESGESGESIHPQSNCPNRSDRIVQPQADPIVNLAAYDVGPYTRGRPGWLVLLWWWVQAIAFPLTPHPCNGLRVALLRLFGAQVGQGVVVRPSARITFPWRVTLGNHSWIGDHVVLYSLAPITIGHHCVISQHSYLCTGSHSLASPQFSLQTAPIVVGNGAWIATDCFIAPGVTIGANAVVGVRSTVLQSLPNQWVCMGTPCRPRYPRPQEAKKNGEIPASGEI
jgi:putative colanic acid biosynthesis acetyltransferase WcaF